MEHHFNRLKNGILPFFIMFTASSLLILSELALSGNPGFLNSFMRSIFRLILASLAMYSVGFLIERKVLKSTVNNKKNK